MLIETFMIENKTNVLKHLVDFVGENPQLIERYLEIVDCLTDEEIKEATHENLLNSARKQDALVDPVTREYYFDYEGEELADRVLAEVLVEGGESNSFVWWLKIPTLWERIKSFFSRKEPEQVNMVMKFRKEA